jgi:membrane protein implicated in regulation of membrane protease activity
MDAPTHGGEPPVALSSLQMSGSILWLIAAAVFGIGEMLTTSFFLAPFAVGAAIAAAAGALGAGSPVTWILFVAVSLLTLSIARPIARSHRRMPAQIRTGTAALIGKHAVVLERIENYEGVGFVRIDGEVWTARALHDDEVIERGTRVEVVDIKGATALVSE